MQMTSFIDELGATALASRFEAMRTAMTPFVGRDEEIDLLLRRWEQAKGGDGRVVLISGEPALANHASQKRSSND
jgi:hypothetical protein